MVIMFYYKLNEQRTELMDKMFEVIAKHLSPVYPFAKVFAGTTNYQKTMELPQLAIFLNKKVKFVYDRGASLERMTAWLLKSLQSVKIQILIFD